MIVSFRKRSFQVLAVVLTALLTTTTLVVLPVVLTKAAAPDYPLVGFGEGTTGGAGGSTVTVSTLADLEKAVSGSEPAIVQISGPISGDTDVMVGSNKTIEGVGKSAVLKGIDLDLDGVTNVIIRNLTITYVLASSTTGDDIHIINGTTHVWIDHNEFYDDLNSEPDKYDGQVDITRGSDNITLSWNRFHDHTKSNLIGHADSNASQDTDHLHVTYHHNWFYNVKSRTPSLRFGTGHVYNNYFQKVSGSTIHSRMGAQMLINNNVFRDTKRPITTTGDSTSDGYANISDNDFGGGTPNITQVGSFTKAPYTYTPDPTAEVLDKVSKYSGVGIISGDSTGGMPPEQGTTPPPESDTTPGATPKPDTTPEATPEPDTTPGATPPAKPGITPGATPPAKPGITPGATPPANPGITPGATPPANPGITPGATPPANPGITPGATPTP